MKLEQLVRKLVGEYGIGPESGAVQLVHDIVALVGPHRDGTAPMSDLTERLAAADRRSAAEADLRAEVAASPWSFKEGTLRERLVWCRTQHQVWAEQCDVVRPADGRPARTRTYAEEAAYHFDCARWYDGMIRDLDAMAVTVAPRDAVNDLTERVDRLLAVKHRDDDQPCSCDDCMSYGAEDAGADWYRIPPANRVVMRILDSGDDRLAGLLTAFRDHEAAVLVESGKRTEARPELAIAREVIAGMAADTGKPLYDADTVYELPEGPITTDANGDEPEHGEPA